VGKYGTLGSAFDRIFRNTLNKALDDVDTDIKAQKKRVDDLIVGNPQPSEVVDSRGGFPVLRDRLEDLSSSVAQKPTKEQVAQSYNKSLSPLGSNVNPATLQRFIDRLGRKNCKVAFWGDSITADGDQVDKQRKYYDMYCDELKESFPYVNFTFANYGIGGRTVEQAADPNYTSPTNFSSPTWATVSGKAWRDYVKDFAPDVIVLAFGMNGATTVLGNKTALDSIESYINTWDTVPSLICLTNFLPREEYLGTSGYTNRLECMRSTREWCKAKGYTCLDIGYTYDALVRGLDYNNLIVNKYSNFDSTLLAGANNQASYVFNAVQFFTNSKYYNARVIATLNISSGGITHIRFRQDLFVFVRSDNTFGVYQTGGIEIYNGSYTGSITSLPIDIKVYGSKITGTIGTTNVNIDTFHVFKDGQFAIGAETGTVTISGVSIYTYEPTKINPILTVNDVVGTYIPNDYNMQLPMGGNGVNHPTSIGTYYLYLNHVSYLCDVLTPSINIEFTGTQTTLLNGWTYTTSPLFVRNGNTVELHANIKGGTVALGATGYAFDFPKGFEPLNSGDYIVPTDAGGSYQGTATIRIDATAKKMMIIKAASLTTADLVRIHLIYMRV
jgi:lysophospholipase L1-like esterase